MKLLFTKVVTKCEECPNCHVTDFGRRFICKPLSAIAFTLGMGMDMDIEVDNKRIPLGCPLTVIDKEEGEAEPRPEYPPLGKKKEEACEKGQDG